MHEVVVLMDVPKREHMMFQNLQLVGSTHGNVFGEEVETPSTVISTETTPYHYTVRVFHSLDRVFIVIS